MIWHGGNCYVKIKGLTHPRKLMRKHFMWRWKMSTCFTQGTCCLNYYASGAYKSNQVLKENGLDLGLDKNGIDRGGNILFIQLYTSCVDSPELYYVFTCICLYSHVFIWIFMYSCEFLLYSFIEFAFINIIFCHQGMLTFRIIFFF